MPKSNFNYVIKFAVLFISVLYLLNPMQKQIAAGMHTISHVFEHSSISHHQEDHLHGHEHSHEHKLITIFAKLFSPEETSDQEAVFFNHIFDKHFAQEYPKIDFKFETVTKHNFWYTFSYKKNSKAIPSPPPKQFFS